MSDALLLGIGTVVFCVALWAMFVIGYSRFGDWYDRDKAEEYRRRRNETKRAKAEGRTAPERKPEDVAHDDLAKLERMSDGS